jgi:phage terminase large subunit-like protein
VFDCYIRAVVEKGRLLFPEDFCFKRELPEDNDKKSLEEIEAQLGPYLYAGNYYNNPVSDDLVEFKDDWFQTYELEAVRDAMNAGKCVMSIDPATRAKESNDPTGIIITKTDIKGMVYVIEASAKKLRPNELIAEIFRLVDIYNPDVTIIETVSANILWIDLLTQEMKKQNKHFRLEEYDPGTTQTKPMKIRKLVPYYARGQIFHRSGLTELERQLREFPRNNNDDLIDALQAQIPYWKGTVIVQKKNLEKYTQAWWDELRARNKKSSGTAEEALFEEYKKPRPTIIRRPSW